MFELDDRVRRIEDRETVGATVAAVSERPDETVYLLSYDEGGEGWWPETALEAE